jgi:hypothetical protein
MASYNSTSPYYRTSLENNYLDVISFRDIAENSDDVLFEVTGNYEYRPDLLAFDLYNDVNLWWVFAVRNKNIIKDPVFDFTSGTKIYLPSQASLNQSLGI